MYALIARSPLNCGNTKLVKVSRSRVVLEKLCEKLKKLNVGIGVGCPVTEWEILWDGTKLLGDKY